MVCHAQAMVGRQKNIGKQIVKITICTSIGIGLASFIHRRNIQTCLTCVGRMELFVFDLRNHFPPLIGGDIIKLPLSNPFRHCIYVVGYAFLFIVPFCYFKIFKFRRKQDISIKGSQRTVLRLSINTISGIDERARSRRKKKNIFSARINCIAWIMEVNYSLLCDDCKLKYHFKLKHCP